MIQARHLVPGGGTGRGLVGESAVAAVTYFHVHFVILANALAPHFECEAPASDASR